MNTALNYQPEVLVDTKRAAAGQDFVGRRGPGKQRAQRLPSSLGRKPPLQGRGVLALREGLCVRNKSRANKVAPQARQRPALSLWKHTGSGLLHRWISQDPFP